MSFSSQKQKPSGFKLILASAVLVLIIGAAYYSASKNKTNETENNNSATTTNDTTAENKSTGLDPKKSVSNVKDAEEVIAKWIEANPQAIINSVQNMQKKMMEEQVKNAQKNISQKTEELFNDSNNAQYAPEGYDASIVEFYDYSCGYCKKAQSVVDELIKSDNKVRVIYKDFPILGEASLEMSKVSIAVNLIAPKSFRKFHDALMKSNERGKQGALKIAKSVGIDTKKLESALKNDKDKIEKIIQDNITLGSSIGINGTPGFVIGEELIPGAVELSSLKEKINAVRSK